MLGVATASHLSIRTWMMKKMPVKFPVIADSDGSLSASLGVLRTIDTGVFGAARAIVILDKEMRMIQMIANSETVTTSPERLRDMLIKARERVEEMEMEAMEEWSMDSNKCNGSYCKDKLDEVDKEV